MVLTTNEHFPKEHRLLKRPQYLLVQNTGQRIHSRLFIGMILNTEKNKTRLGITATRRYGNSVERTRLKRLVRESFRKKILDLPSGIDLVIVPKKMARECTSSQIFNDLSTLGKKIIRFMENNR